MRFKYDALFGNVQSAEQLLEKFYVARQMSDESVVRWGCRLEELSRNISQTGSLTHSTFHDMLQNKLWSGLHNSHIKLSLRHKFDSGEDFQSLLVAAMSVELESDFVNYKPKSVKVAQQHQQQASASGVESKLEEMLKHIKALEKRLGCIEELQKKNFSKQKSHQLQKSGYCYKCGEDDLYHDECPKLGRGPSQQPGNKRPKKQNKALVESSSTDKDKKPQGNLNSP